MIPSPAVIELLERYGGQCFQDCIFIYSLADVVERNDTYETSVYCPGFVTIGDDSGGRAFVCKEEGVGPVFLVGHGSMSPDDFVHVYPSVSDWLAKDCPIPDAQE